MSVMLFELCINILVLELKILILNLSIVRVVSFRRTCRAELLLYKHIPLKFGIPSEEFINSQFVFVIFR